MIEEQGKNNYNDTFYKKVQQQLKPKRDRNRKSNQQEKNQHGKWK